MVNRINDVGTVQPVPVKVYDYYKPGVLLLLVILQFLVIVYDYLEFEKKKKKRKGIEQGLNSVIFGD